MIRCWTRLCGNLLPTVVCFGKDKDGNLHFLLEGASRCTHTSLPVILGSRHRPSGRSIGGRSWLNRPISHTPPCRPDASSRRPPLFLPNSAMICSRRDKSWWGDREICMRSNICRTEFPNGMDARTAFLEPSFKTRRPSSPAHLGPLIRPESITVAIKHKFLLFRTCCVSGNNNVDQFTPLPVWPLQVVTSRAYMFPHLSFAKQTNS
jgi:hypothetical protein